jgi:poly(A) polymerase
MTELIWRALRSAEPPLYVVGGAVRDWALGQTSKDLDIAVAGSVAAVGRALAADTGGHFFVLHPASQTARVALPGGAWVDLVALPDGLEPDLWRRDFTINAMALPLHDYIVAAAHGAVPDVPPAALVDPSGGWADLQRGVVRMPRPDAFANDPLRALRGLRMVHTLPRPPRAPAFAPDAATLDEMRAFAPVVAQVSPERVRDEWLALLDGPRSAEAVPRAASLGFLDVLMPSWREMEGVTQNPYHHLDVWEHTLEVMRQFNAVTGGSGPVTVPDDIRPLVMEYLAEMPTPVHTRRALIRQGILLHDAGKPSARTEAEDGRIKFLGHEHTSAEIAREWSARWRLSGRQRDFLGALTGMHMRPGGLVAKSVTPRAIQRFFRDAGAAAPALLLLNAADRLAARGPWTTDAEVEEQVHGSWELLRLYFRMRDTVALPLPLSGRDIMAAYQLPPGPLIGRVVQGLRDIHAETPFADRESALAAAREFLPDPEPPAPQ